ncbi:hypothetical protein HK405_004394, partial [Cladochytrium tenue]
MSGQHQTAHAARVGVAIVALLCSNAIADAAATAVDIPSTALTNSTTVPSSADQNPLVDLTFIFPLPYATVEYFKPKSLYNPDLFS